MALASGYTQLEYIQSSGTQYIDTGFKPNQDTRIVCKIANWPITQVSTDIFGSRTSSGASDLFLIGITDSKQFRTDYYNSKTSITSSVSIEDTPVTIDKNKNVTTFSHMGGSYTNTSGTFTCTYNLFLFACNTGGSASLLTNGVKLYSCQIYDNGTLVRDFIPCKNTSGVIGLWDDVNSTFYTNAGTGTFTAGEMPKGTHRTLIAGTGYDIKSGRVLIGGTGYDIKKGRTLIDGTGYDISFGIPVGELAVGTSVYMNVNGTREEWLVVHQGKPSNLYDDTCYGTWLLEKYLPGTSQQWGNYYESNYASSLVNSYLNNTFLNLFDAEIRSIIKQIKIPYNTGSSIKSGSAGLSAKIFLLSAYELGYTTSDKSGIPIDGARLSYFEAGDSDSANNKRIATDESGITASWVTRSSHATYGNDVWYIYADQGNLMRGDLTKAYQVRPTLILPFDDAKIDDNFNIVV